MVVARDSARAFWGRRLHPAALSAGIVASILTFGGDLEFRILSAVDDDIEGEGWRAIRPDPQLWAEQVTIDPLVPKADWFWLSLQRFCVPDCCGLDAYDFSKASVAWACGWGTERPAAQGCSDWRDEHPGDPVELARQLRQAAQKIRRLDAQAVSGSLFNDILTPEAYALLFEDLAAKADPGT